MNKTWSIHGGIHPQENKAQSNATPIATIPMANELIIPLNQHIGAPARAICRVGDHVKKGQMIAEAQGYISAPVHASTSGTIIEIASRPIPHTSGLSDTCVVLKPDFKDEWLRMEIIDDISPANKHLLLERIRTAGITGMGGAGFPTSVKMNPRADQLIHTLIINGTECEPYITADDRLMRERADKIMDGVAIIASLLNDPKKVLIGIEDNKPEAIAAMREAAKDRPYNVVSFPTKYPSGGEKQLIQILTGQEVASAGIPADTGIVVQNVGTAYAVARAVKHGEALVSRVTTVVGEALGIQQNIEVPIGTPMRHILEQHHFSADKAERIIVGGPMMGYAMDHAEAPIVKTTNCLLVPSEKEFPRPAAQQACIRCGMCAEACPAQLLPQQLFWFSQAEDFDRLKSHNLFDCIECGACSYVCPSNIPLVQYYRASKGAIRYHDEEKSKAERSRQRFEFRQERMAHAEKEKEKKRAERKRAAEKAKAIKNNSDENTPIPAKATPANKEKHADKGNILSKLERAKSSAESRVVRAKKQLEEAENEHDDARTESLKARLKEAERKLHEAQKRIDQAHETIPTDDTKSDVPENDSAKIEQKILNLEKRLHTAREKLQIAEREQSNTTEALRLGIRQLETKLKDNKKHLPS